MNKQRRKRIDELTDMIQDIQSSLDELREEEQEAYDNLPEGIQDSERGDAMCDAIEAMENADSSLQDAYDYLIDLL